MRLMRSSGFFYFNNSLRGWRTQKGDFYAVFYKQKKLERCFIGKILFIN